MDGGHSECLATALSLQLPDLKDTTVVFEFLCDAERPSSFVPEDGDHSTATSDPPSFLSPFANGLVVFTFTIEYNIDNTIMSDVRFVIHKQALLDLVAASSSATRNVETEQPPHMPWSEWGPSRTRWFDIHEGLTECSSLT